ncbi:MAG: acetolactate synthase catalytic subunit [Planctomycetes bacterium SM23_32]|nr:MAG: acetolactate synthase catalytic subunit [Planctomycetes bacterium SM23_32]
MARRGGKILVDALLEQGVEHLFGLPGGAVIALFDELYEAPIKTILTRHEQGAGHMADGYARATGKVGVCVATSGPGATNLVTAISTAYMDSIPLVAITGQVKTHLIGNDAFQEADMTGISRPITKHNYLVKDARELGRIVREAFYIASTGRPGPVLIDLPADVTAQSVEGEIDTAMQLPGYRPSAGGHPGQIRKAAEAINASARPVLYVGGGVITSGASEQLRELARKGNIPVTTTLMGLGVFPETDPLSLHMLGMHGTVYANYAVTHCDLLIAVGARFDDRITGKIEQFAPSAKIIHVDVDPTSIGKNVRVDIPVVGDAGAILTELLPLVQQHQRGEWLEKIAQWKRDFPLSYRRGGDEVKPQAVIEELYRATEGEAIVVTDVGQHQMWAAQYYQYTEPRTFLSSGGLGTMGFGLPAGIGAQFGRPDKQVVVVTSDGSLQMNIQEMATAVLHRLPIKIALLNNGYLGMVRQWQELFFDRRYSHTYLANGNPDFVKLAEAYGAVGILVEEPEEVAGALERAMALKEVPVLMDFHTAPEENVFPMVPAGEAIDQMLSGMA